MDNVMVHSIPWCDTRDMTADGHAKGSINREMLLQVMGGIQSFKRDLNCHASYRAGQTSCSAAA
eukprot:8713095-Pyramimonas_sp.AAC.1